MGTTFAYNCTRRKLLYEAAFRNVDHRCSILHADGMHDLQWGTVLRILLFKRHLVQKSRVPPCMPTRKSFNYVTIPVASCARGKLNSHCSNVEHRKHKATFHVIHRIVTPIMSRLQKASVCDLSSQIERSSGRQPNISHPVPRSTNIRSQVKRKKQMNTINRCRNENKTVLTRVGLQFWGKRRVFTALSPKCNGVGYIYDSARCTGLTLYIP